MNRLKNATTLLALPIAAALYAGPAFPCSPAIAPSPLQQALLPARVEVPQNPGLFVRPVGVATTVTLLKDGALEATLTSEDGDIDLGTLEADAQYDLQIEAGGEVQTRTFRTTAVVDDEAPAAPGVSTTLFESGGHFDFANTCDSGPGPIVWRDARASADVIVDLADDAIAAVRLNSAGEIVELSERGSFFIGDAADLDAAAFATIDAAGNVSEPVLVEDDFDGGGCAQTSTSTAMALALVGLVLARRRR